MRIGFLATVDPRDPTAISGMPFHMRRELSQVGEIVDLTPFPLRPRSWLRDLRRLVPSTVSRAARTLLGRGDRPPLTSLDETAASVLAHATLTSRAVAQQVARHRLDVLFGCCMSTLLYGLDTDVPIIYASDTTARLIQASYWEFAGRPAEFSEALESIERAGLRRAARLVFATDLARRSAIADYGVDPARAHVVKLGANVTPSQPLAAPPPLAPPSRADLRLLFVGLEPRRKRLDLAVDVVEQLRAEGWAARLAVIGQPTERARRSPWVRCLGPLGLASPLDRVLHRRLLARTHLLLLPSEAEAYGIAPCEAAHHGRPSVVSGVGGLPEVVLDGVTGAVVPPEAGARDFARAIVEVVDPSRYPRMCAAALERAQRELSWDAWRRGVTPLIELALAERAASRRADSLAEVTA